jgi:MSHA biogenesis protein MshQ
MNKYFVMIFCCLTWLMWAAGAQAATCTTRASGSWNSTSIWTCTGSPAATIPGAADTAVIASPNTVTLAGTTSVGSLTLNSGAILSDTAGNTLTVSANLTNNGNISTSRSGKLNVTGAASVISGIGSYAGFRFYTSGATPQIAAGAILNFSGTSRFYTGFTSANSNALGSLLTINGTINSTQTAGTKLFYLYANSTVIGASGVINASVATAAFSNSTAKVSNNGSVSLTSISQKSSTNGWTQGVNASLTVKAVSTVGVLTASATGNTVTYTLPATPITPAGNTYYNLAGTGVVCPVSFTVLGSSPCVTKVGAGSVTSSPTSCVNLTGAGTVAWTSPGNAIASDTAYATAGNVVKNVTTNYLKCSGFNFSSVPVGATISGVTVYVTRKTSGGTIRDAFVYLVKAGTISTVFNGATTTNYTTADVAEMHGGMTNSWGASWTDTDVKASTFGVVFAAKNTSTTSNSNQTVSVNFIQIRVDYAATNTDHVAIFAANVGSTCTISNVTVTPHTAAHTAPTGGGGTIRLTTSDNKGDWSIVTGAGTLSNGTANDGLATYAYASGETSVTLGLMHTNPGTITIGVADNATGSSLLANTQAGEKANTIAFAGGGFTVTDAAGVAISSMTQVAGTTSPTYYLKATSASCVNAFNNVVKSVDMAFECIDPVACQTPVLSMTNASTNAVTALQKGVVAGSDPALVTTYNAVSLNFNANSLAPFKLNYPDVGNITLYFRYSAASMLSESNPFVVQPAGFVLSGIKRSSDNMANPAAANATGAAFVKGGEAFTATVTAVNSQGVATPNYGHEVTPEYVKLSTAIVSPAGGNNPAITCSDSTNANTCDSSATPDLPLFGAFTAGVATGVNFAWNEVGVITLTPHVGDFDYLGTGDVTGTTSANIGRFTLGKFSLQNPLLDNRADICNNGVLISDGATACPLFSYMGEEVDATFILVPMSLNNVASQNYVNSATAANNYAKLDPSIFANLNIGAVDLTDVAAPVYLTSRISNAAMPLVTCNTTPCFTQPGGAGSQAMAEVNVPFMLTRGVAADGPYSAVNVGIAPLDSDGAAVDAAGLSGPGSCNNASVTACYDLDTNAAAGNDHVLLGSTSFRYGRVRISSAYGSELLPLSMPLAVEYWDGVSYVTCVDDSISLLVVTTGNYLLNLSAAKTVLTPPLIASGIGQIVLSAPGSGNNGSVDLTASSFSYLPLAGSARATFGVYGGKNIFVYRGRRGR